MYSQRGDLLAHSKKNKRWWICPGKESETRTYSCSNVFCSIVLGDWPISSNIIARTCDHQSLAWRLWAVHRTVLPQHYGDMQDTVARRAGRSRCQTMSIMNALVQNSVQQMYCHHRMLVASPRAPCPIRPEPPRVRRVTLLLYVPDILHAPPPGGERR